MRLGIGLLLAVATGATAPAAIAATAPSIDARTTDNGVNLLVDGDYCGDVGGRPVREHGLIHVVVTAGTRVLREQIDPCSDVNRTRRGRDWTLATTANFYSADRWSEVDIAVNRGLQRTRTYVFGYRITTSDGLAGRGRIRIAVRYHPAQRVWDQTDDFVNVCINDNHKLYSSNLRLYCVIGGWANVHSTVTPSRST